MKIWKRVRDNLPKWPWARETTELKPEQDAQHHVDAAQNALSDLLNDHSIPQTIRTSLSDEFQQLQVMLDKLEHGHIHISVFGRVGVGKSALLNALLGKHHFSTSALHGETRRANMSAWQEIESGGVYLIDTPGINEIDGEERERLAHDVAGRSDLVLFVVEGDISASEREGLRRVINENRPVLLVLNKIDRYSQKQQQELISALKLATHELIPDGYLVTAAADPAERIIIQVDEQGNEQELRRQPPHDVNELKTRLWQVLEQEGKTLTALNASLFAGRLSDDLRQRVMEQRKEFTDKVVRNYCIAKGVTVALNPVPVSDIVAAIVVDVSLVIHLSKVYGLPIQQGEARTLITTIGTQIGILTGTVWAVHFISSALKGSSLGLSTVVTAAAQGAVAYYSTYIVGKAAHRYFEEGKSWGAAGPKHVVQEILANLDRDSLLMEAREEILARLKAR